MCSYKSLLPQPCSWYSKTKNQIGMCSYKSLLSQPCSWYSKTERRTRYEFAATSTYCLSPDIGTHRHREELDRNVQLQVLIASVLQSVLKDREQNQIGMCRYKSLLPLLKSVLTDGEKNQIGMCRYKSLLPQPCSRYSKTEQNQIGMCSYKSLLPQPCSQY